MRATLYREHTDNQGNNSLEFVGHYKDTTNPLTRWRLKRRVKALRKAVGARERTEYAQLPGGSLLLTYLHTKGGAVVHYW